MSVTTKTKVDEYGRVCTKCKEYKLWSEFHVSNKEATGHKQRCNSCESKIKKIYDDHYRRDNAYGLFPGQFEKLLQEQNNKCGICHVQLIIGGQHATSSTVDHCHKTGKVRGILCLLCNSGIGKMKDNVQILESAAAYLRRYQ